MTLAPEADHLMWLVDSFRRMTYATLRDEFSERDRRHAAVELSYLLENLANELKGK